MLIGDYPRVEVAANAGVTYVTLEEVTSRQEEAIRRLVEHLPGVGPIEVSSRPFLMAD